MDDKESFFLIRRWMLDLGLKSSELRVYALIYNFTANRGGYRGSRRYLLNLTGLGRTTLFDALKALENKGLIRREKMEVIDFTGAKHLSTALTAVRPDSASRPKTGLHQSEIRTSSVRNPDSYNNIDKRIEEKKDINKRSTGLTACLDEEFEKLWEKYPRKQGKHEARRAYCSARRSGVTRETIAAGLERYLAAIGRDGVTAQFVKRGGSWFRDRLWEDADIGPVKRGFPPSAETRAAQNYMQHSYTAADLLAMGIDTGEDVYEDD